MFALVRGEGQAVVATPLCGSFRGTLIPRPLVLCGHGGSSPGESQGSGCFTRSLACPVASHHISLLLNQAAPASLAGT